MRITGNMTLGDTQFLEYIEQRWTCPHIMVPERCRRGWEKDDELLSCNLGTSLEKESVR